MCEYSGVHVCSASSSPRHGPVVVYRIPFFININCVF